MREHFSRGQGSLTLGAVQLRKLVAADEKNARAAAQSNKKEMLVPPAHDRGGNTRSSRD